MAYGWQGRLKLGLLCALGMTAAFAAGQVKYSGPGEPTTLDGEAVDYLKYASVRIELGIDHDQEAKAQAVATSQIFKVALAAVKSYAAGDDEQKKFKIDSVSSPLNFSLPMGSLSLGQQRRLRQIAMQQSPLSCLLTPELRLALDLTPPQIERLRAIFKEKQLRMELAYKPVIASFEPRFRDVAGMVNTDEHNDEKRFAQVSKAVDAYIQLLLEMERGINRVKFADRSDEGSLKVLTLAQKARLKVLQGKPFKLRTNM